MPILRTVTSIRVSRAAVRGALVAAAVLSFCAILAAPALAGGRERDRDRDGLADRFERRHSKTDPRRWDTDRDGLSDGYEVRVSKTNPRKADTDRDGLSDGDEVRKHGTNPRKADTDGDGLGDGAEIRGGSDPRDPASPGTGTPPGGGGTPTGGGTPPGGGGTPPDITAPATAILTGTTGVQGSTTAAFTFTADEPATFQCRLDGGSFASCTSPKTYTSLADGPHTFDVRATDKAGNVDKTPASSSWTVDATAPATSITSGPSATTTSTSAQIVFAADEPESTFQCRLDTGPWASCTSAAALTDLALGPHTFEVRATDTVGNTDATPAQASWTIEQAVPDTSITAGPSGTVFEFSATLAFTSPDPGVTFECRLNGDAWAACSSPTSYLDLLVGPQTFEVRAKSPGGVVDPTPAVRTWTVEDPGGGIS